MRTYRELWALWGLGFVFLFIFCWLGTVAFKAAEVFRGFGDVLPAATRLSMTYGPVAFPFLGIVAAVSLIFLQRQWLQYCVILAAVLLIVCIFRSLLFSYFGPSHPN